MPPVEQAATVLHNSAGALFSSWEKDRLVAIQQEAVEALVADYLRRFSEFSGAPVVNCGTGLGWLELEARAGSRPTTDDTSDINTPGVAAALVQKRYVAQTDDEISLEVGDMISVIDMSSPADSVWWRGKRGLEVGFFPCECVQLIGDRVPAQLTQGGSHRRSATLQPRSSIIRRQGKLTAFFRSFIQPRPSRRRLKQNGMFRDRVFGCDLSEHVLISGREVPVILTSCAEFIEAYGIVDGIYRLSGVNSNIKRLRSTFDESRIPDLSEPSVRQDIHSVSCLLKQYFRELPNPLLTYQLYDKFVAAVQSVDDQRLLRMRDVVQQLPPPHYRSLEYLVRHLCRVSQHGHNTGMTAKNLAIVWAPNLARSKLLEAGGVMALQGVGVQAVIVEYLIRYCELVFNDKLPAFPRQLSSSARSARRARPRSLAICSPTRLLSLEEARTKTLEPPSKEANNYLEVGGGPAALPTKYHTVLESMSPRKSGSLRFVRAPIAWRSLFRGRTTKHHPDKGSDPVDIALTSKTLTESDLSRSRVCRHPLRSVRSAESLAPAAPPHRNAPVLDSGGDSECTSPTREGSPSEPDSTISAGDSTSGSQTPVQTESREPYSTSTLTELTPDGNAGLSEEKTRLREEVTRQVDEKSASHSPDHSRQVAAQGSERAQQVAGQTPHTVACRGASLPPASSAATSCDITQLPTDSDQSPVAPHYQRPAEAGLRESPDTERCTPGDEDATGLDLSEMGDEEASPEESKISGLVPEALEMLDQRLNASANGPFTDDSARDSQEPYESVSTLQNGEDLDTTYATYETFEFPATTSVTGEDTEAEGRDVDCVNTHNEDYENTPFESAMYENSTFASVADLPYENIGEQQYENVPPQRDREDHWVYEDVVPVQTPSNTVDDCVYEPVGMTLSTCSPTESGFKSNEASFTHVSPSIPDVSTLSGDEVYAQVKQFKRTLNEVNSIVQMDRDSLSEVKSETKGEEEVLKNVTSAQCSVEAASLMDESRAGEQKDTSAEHDVVTSPGQVENERRSEGQCNVQDDILHVSVERPPDLVLGGSVREDAVPIEKVEEGNAVVEEQRPEESRATSDVTKQAPKSSQYARNASPDLSAPTLHLEPVSLAETVVAPDQGLGSQSLDLVPSLESPALDAVDVSRLQEAVTAEEGRSASEPTEHANQPDLIRELWSVSVAQNAAKESVDVVDSRAAVDVSSSSVPGAAYDSERSETESDSTSIHEGPSIDQPRKAGVVEVDAADECVKALPAVVSDASDFTGVASEQVSRAVDAHVSAEAAESDANESSAVEATEDSTPAIPESDDEMVKSHAEETNATETVSGSVSSQDYGAPQNIPAVCSSPKNGEPVLETSDTSVATPEASVPALDTCPSWSNTWPRLPSDASCDRMTLSDRSRRPMSASPRKTSAPAGTRGRWESGEPEQEPTWMRNEMRRPCERRASFRQLLSRFESFGSSELAPAEVASEQSARLAEHAVVSVHGDSPVRGYHPLTTRSLPRPAARRDSAPACSSSLSAVRRGVSPRPVRRHLSQQYVSAEDRRTSTGTNPFWQSRTPTERGRWACEKPERPDQISASSNFESLGSGDTVKSLRRHQSVSSADPLAATTQAHDAPEPRPPVPDVPDDQIDVKLAEWEPSEAEAAQSAAEARQRIERYKQERRNLLRERFRPDAFLRDKSDREWPRRQRESADHQRSPSPPAESDVQDNSEERASTAGVKAKPVRRADSLHSSFSSNATTSSAPVPVPLVVTRSDPLDDVNVRERVAGWSRGPSTGAPQPKSGGSLSTATARAVLSQRSVSDAAGNIRSIAARFEGPPVAATRNDGSTSTL